MTISIPPADTFSQAPSSVTYPLYEFLHHGGVLSLYSGPEHKETAVDPKVREQAEKLAKAEAEAKLFPFPATDWNDENEQYTHCPKCGQWVYSATFSAEDASHPEYLQWHCGCEYTWHTWTKDAE